MLKLKYRFILVKISFFKKKPLFNVAMAAKKHKISYYIIFTFSL